MTMRQGCPIANKAISVLVIIVFTATSVVWNPAPGYGETAGFSFANIFQVANRVSSDALLSLPAEIGTITETSFPQTIDHSPISNQLKRSGNWGNPDYHQLKENESQDRPQTIAKKIKTKDRFVVLIQDAHANPQAQTNIKSILNFLSKQYPGLVVGVEGTVGALHPEYFDLMPDYPEAGEAVVQDLHQKGELSGAELFAWENYISGQRSGISVQPETSPESRVPSPAVVGVENLDLYRDDLNAYRKILFKADEIESLLNPLRSKLERESSRVFSPELRDLLRERSRRKEGKFNAAGVGAGISMIPARSRGFGAPSSQANLEAYLVYFEKTILKHLAIDLEDSFEQLRFPNLVRLNRLRTFQNDIEQETLAAAWWDFLKDLEAKISDEKGLLAALRHFAASNGLLGEGETVAAVPVEIDRALLPRKLLEYLFFLDQKKNLDLSSHAEALKSFAPIILRSELDVTQLFREVGELEDLLIAKLAVTEAEEKLVGKLQAFSLFEKALRLELTRRDYKTILSATNHWTDPSSGGRDSEAFTNYMKNSGPLKDFFAEALEFYKIAEERDQALVTNALTLTEPRAPHRSPGLGGVNESRVVALIAGGFHTDGITELLKQQGTPYAVIAPRITKTDRGELYRNTMSDANADLSAYFKVKNPFPTKQEAVFFKEALEVAAPTLFEGYGLKGPDIAKEVEESFETNPVLSRAVTSELVPSADHSTVRFTPRILPPQASVVPAAPMSGSVAFWDALETRSETRAAPVDVTFGARQVLRLVIADAVTQTATLGGVNFQFGKIPAAQMPTARSDMREEGKGLELSISQVERGFSTTYQDQKVHARAIGLDPYNITNYLKALRVQTQEGMRVVPKVHTVYFPAAVVDSAEIQRTGKIAFKPNPRFNPQVRDLLEQAAVEGLFKLILLNSVEDYRAMEEELGVAQYRLVNAIGMESMPFALFVSNWVGPTLSDYLIEHPEHHTVVLENAAQMLAALHNAELIADDSHIDNFVVEEETQEVRRIDLEYVKSARDDRGLHPEWMEGELNVLAYGIAPYTSGKIANIHFVEPYRQFRARSETRQAGQSAGEVDGSPEMQAAEMRAQEERVAEIKAKQEELLADMREDASKLAQFSWLQWEGAAVVPWQELVREPTVEEKDAPRDQADPVYGTPENRLNYWSNQIDVRESFLELVARALEQKRQLADSEVKEYLRRTHRYLVLGVNEDSPYFPPTWLQLGLSTKSDEALRNQTTDLMLTDLGVSVYTQRLNVLLDLLSQPEIAFSDVIEPLFNLHQIIITPSLEAKESIGMFAFPFTNNSFSLNQANAVLRLLGHQGISHDGIDFALLENREDVPTAFEHFDSVIRGGPAYEPKQKTDDRDRQRSEVRSDEGGLEFRREPFHYVLIKNGEEVGRVDVSRGFQDAGQELAKLLTEPEADGLKAEASGDFLTITAKRDGETRDFQASMLEPKEIGKIIRQADQFRRSEARSAPTSSTSALFRQEPVVPVRSEIRPEESVEEGELTFRGFQGVPAGQTVLGVPLAYEPHAAGEFEPTELVLKTPGEDQDAFMERTREERLKKAEEQFDDGFAVIVEHLAEVNKLIKNEEGADERAKRDRDLAHAAFATIQKKINVLSQDDPDYERRKEDLLAEQENFRRSGQIAAQRMNNPGAAAKVFGPPKTYLNSDILGEWLGHLTEETKAEMLKTAEERQDDLDKKEQAREKVLARFAKKKQEEGRIRQQILEQMVEENRSFSTVFYNQFAERILTFLETATHPMSVKFAKEQLAPAVAVASGIRQQETVTQEVDQLRQEEMETDGDIALFTPVPFSPEEYRHRIHPRFGSNLRVIVVRGSSSLDDEEVAVLTHLKVAIGADANPPLLIVMQAEDFDRAYAMIQKGAVAEVVVSSGQEGDLGPGEIILNPSGPIKEAHDAERQKQKLWKNVLRRYLQGLNLDFEDAFHVNTVSGELEALHEVAHNLGASRLGVGLKRTEMMTEETENFVLAVIESLGEALRDSPQARERWTVSKEDTARQKGVKYAWMRRRALESMLAWVENPAVQQLLNFMEEGVREELVNPLLAGQILRERTFDFRADKNGEIFDPLIALSAVEDVQTEGGFKLYRKNFGRLMLILQIAAYLEALLATGEEPHTQLEVILPMVEGTRDIDYFKRVILPTAEAIVAFRVHAEHGLSEEGVEVEEEMGKRIHQITQQINFGLMLETPKAVRDHLDNFLQDPFWKVFNFGMNDAQMGEVVRGMNIVQADQALDDIEGNLLELKSTADASLKRKISGWQNMLAQARLALESETADPSEEVLSILLQIVEAAGREGAEDVVDVVSEGRIQLQDAILAIYLEREDPWIAMQVGKLDPKFLWLIDDVARRFQEHNEGLLEFQRKSLCFCGEIAQDPSFGPFLRHLEFKYPAVPFSRSMAPSSLAENIFLWHRLKDLRQDQLESLFDVYGHQTQEESRALANAYYDLPKEVMIDVERSREAGSYYTFYRKDIDPINDRGSAAEFDVIKRRAILLSQIPESQQVRVRLPQLSSEEGMATADLPLALEALAGVLILQPEEQTQVEAAFQFLTQVRDLFKINQEANPEAYQDHLYAGNLDGFLVALEEAYPTGWLSPLSDHPTQEEFQNRQQQFWETYYHHASPVRKFSARLTHMLLEEVDPPEFSEVDAVQTLKTTKGSIELRQRQRVGWMRKDEEDFLVQRTNELTVFALMDLEKLAQERPEILNMPLGEVIAKVPVISSEHLNKVLEEHPGIAEMTVEKVLKNEVLSMILFEEALKEEPQLMFSVFQATARSDVREEPDAGEELRIGYRLQRTLAKVESKMRAVKEYPEEVRKALNIEFVALLEENADISYGLWRFHRLHFFGKFFLGWEKMRNVFSVGNQRFAVHMQTLRAFEFMEELNDSKEAVVSVASRVFQKIRSYSVRDYILALRMALLMSGIIRAEYKDTIEKRVPTRDEIGDLVRETLKDSEIPEMVQEEIAWLCYNHQMLSLHELITTDEMAKAMGGVLKHLVDDETGEWLPNAQNLLEMLFVMTLSDRMGLTDPDKTMLRMREGADSPLAIWQAFFLATISLIMGKRRLGLRLRGDAKEDKNLLFEEDIVDIAKKARMKVTMAEGQRLGGREIIKGKNVNLLPKQLPELFQPRLVEEVLSDYLAHADIEEESEEIREKLTSLFQTESGILQAFSWYQDAFQPYLARVLSHEPRTLMKQMIFSSHLRILKDKEDFETTPIAFVPLPRHGYNVPYEILIGFTEDSPALAHLAATVLYMNGFFIENIESYETGSGEGAILRILGSFSNEEENPARAKQNIRDEIKYIFGPVGFWTTRLKNPLKNPKKQRMIDRFLNLGAYKTKEGERKYESITITKRPETQMQPADVGFIQDSEVPDVSVLSITTPDRPGLFSLTTGILAHNFGGLMIQKVRFDDLKGGLPRMLFYLTTQEGRPLTSNAQTKVVTTMKEWLDLETVIMEGEKLRDPSRSELRVSAGVKVGILAGLIGFLALAMPRAVSGAQAPGVYPKRAPAVSAVDAPVSEAQRQAAIDRILNILNRMKEAQTSKWMDVFGGGGIQRQWATDLETLNLEGLLDTYAKKVNVFVDEENQRQRNQGKPIKFRRLSATALGDVAESEGIPLTLLLAIGIQEAVALNPFAIAQNDDETYDRGLFQINDETAKQFWDRARKKKIVTTSKSYDELTHAERNAILFDPITNLKFAVLILGEYQRQLVSRHADLMTSRGVQTLLTAHAYNMGVGGATNDYERLLNEVVADELPLRPRYGVIIALYANLLDAMTKPTPVPITIVEAPEPEIVPVQPIEEEAVPEAEQDIGFNIGGVTPAEMWQHATTDRETQKGLLLMVMSLGIFASGLFWADFLRKRIAAEREAEERDGDVEDERVPSRSEIRPGADVRPIRTVLVVDDEKSIRITLAAFLKGAGYQVQTAENGEEASVLLEKEGIDLVVSDIDMPGKISGIDLANGLEGKGVLVVLMTGEDAGREELFQLAEAGIIQKVFQKPVGKEAVLQVAKELSARSEMRPEADARSAPMLSASALPRHERVARVRSEMRDDKTETSSESQTIVRVLVVDDEAPIRQLMSVFLGMRDYTIVTASDGEEGLEVFRTAQAEGNPFDMVVTDMRMSPMDGVTMVEQMMEEFPDVRDGKVGVTFVSAYNVDKEAAQVREKGNPVVAAVKKPFKMDELNQILDEVEALVQTRRSEVRKINTDLVVTDRDMPNMTGDVLARAIRGRGEVPFILMTGDNINNSELLEQLKREGIIVEGLIKPFGLEEVLEVIHKIEEPGSDESVTRSETRIDALRSEIRDSAQAINRVLLVDDEAMIRQVFKMLLEAEGYEVVTAENGQEAIDLFANGESFDLIITDLKMPEVSGVAMVEKLMEMEETAELMAKGELPVIFISGYGAVNETDKAKEEGVLKEGLLYRALAKPVSAKVLYDIIGVLDKEVRENRAKVVEPEVPEVTNSVRISNMLQHVLNNQMAYFLSAEDPAIMSKEMLRDLARRTLVAFRVFDLRHLRAQDGKLYIPKGHETVIAYHIHSTRSDKIYKTPNYEDTQGARFFEDEELEQLAEEVGFDQILSLFGNEIRELEELRIKLLETGEVDSALRMQVRQLGERLQAKSGELFGRLRPESVAAPVSQTRKYERILVVDDEAGNRNLFSRILHSMPLLHDSNKTYTVVSASDGAEALEKLKEGEFDLVLSDINMPGVDGIQLVWNMIEAGINIPVILMTGFSEREIPFEEFRRKGQYADILNKPFNKDMLQEAIQKISSRSEVRDLKIPAEAIPTGRSEIRRVDESMLSADMPTDEVKRALLDVEARGGFDIVFPWISLKLQEPVAMAAEAVGIYSVKGVAMLMPGGINGENLSKAQLWIAAQLTKALTARTQEQGIANPDLERAIKGIVKAVPSTVQLPSSMIDQGPAVHVDLSFLSGADWQELIQSFPIILANLVSLNAKLMVNVNGDSINPEQLRSEILRSATEQGIKLASNQITFVSVPSGKAFASLKKLDEADALMAGSEAAFENIGYHKKIGSRWVAGDNAVTNMPLLAAEISTVLYAALDQRVDRFKIHQPSEYGSGALLQAVLTAVQAYLQIRIAA